MLKIARTNEAAPRQGAASTHQNRLVVAPSDYANQSQFLLMAEDWFAPPSGFPTHPHRGMETVTFVLEGAAEIGGAEVREGQVAWADPSDHDDVLELSAKNRIRALIYASEPIEEPVVAGGPFVMNTEAEIHEAFADLRAGRLTV